MLGWWNGFVLVRKIKQTRQTRGVHREMGIYVCIYIHILSTCIYSDVYIRNIRLCCLVAQRAGSTVTVAAWRPATKPGN